MTVAVMINTPAAASTADRLADRVLDDCIDKGQTAASCRCMVDGLTDRLSEADARRFFLLALDEPATGLPMLSLDEVDAFTGRLEAAFAAIGRECHS